MHVDVHVDVGVDVHVDIHVDVHIDVHVDVHNYKCTCSTYTLTCMVCIANIVYGNLQVSACA